MHNNNWNVDANYLLLSVVVVVLDKLCSKCKRNRNLSSHPFRPTIKRPFIHRVMSLCCYCFYCCWQFWLLLGQKGKKMNKRIWIVFQLCLFDGRLCCNREEGNNWNNIRNSIQQHPNCVDWANINFMLPSCDFFLTVSKWPAVVCRWSFDDGENHFYNGIFLSPINYS